MSALVVLGDLILDVVTDVAEPVVPDSDTAAVTTLALGGAGANVAAWAAHAGGRVRLIGRAGDDAAGRDHLAAADRRGIEVHVALDAQAATGTIVVLAAADGTRTMLTDRGANLRLRREDVPDPIGREGDHLHVSGYALLHPGPRDAALEALRRARAARLTTSVDASSVVPLRQLGAEAFLDLIGPIDVLRANAAEAALLTGEATPRPRVARDAAAALAARVPLVVVTDGSVGAWAAEGDRVTHLPAAAHRVRDTVGAGDALTAGFLVARLDGAGTSDALAAGLRLAGEAVARPGAQPPRSR